MRARWRRASMAIVLAAAGCAGRDPHFNHDAGVAEGEGEGEDPQCALPTNKPGLAAANAIYFGSRAPTLVPLTAAQREAVVGISDASSFGAWCSGTLIADDIVLTAQHCTEGVGDNDFVVLFGEDDLSPVLRVASVQKLENPDRLDIAMIRLAARPADTIDVEPIRVGPAPSTDDLGTLVENAGFGETHDGSHGRYFVSEVLQDITDDHIEVFGEGTRGVCFGDSGGPTLHTTVEGEVRTSGVLSFGDSDCMFTDEYQRADTVLAWIESVTGAMPAPSAQPCPADLDDVGACSLEQSQATFCSGGNIEVDLCAAGEVCIATATDANRRCRPVADDPCGGVTRFGGCDGEQLSWCDDDGVVQTRDCFACDERCLRIDDVVGYGCVASNCGELTREGECDGTVSRWCDRDGQLGEYDCADDGLTCEYIGPTLGYFCYDAAACQGLDYQGQCDGTVLSWCEDNEPVQVDCADDGQSCVFLNDDEGFVCQ